MADKRSMTEEAESSDEESEEEEEKEEGEKMEDENNEDGQSSAVEEMELEEKKEEESKPVEKKNKKKKKGKNKAAKDSEKPELPRPKHEIRRGREMYVSEKTEEALESKNEDKMKAFMVHPKNKRLYNKLKTKETIRERRTTALKDRREAIELVKTGKMSQEELDYWRPKKAKLTLHEKRKKAYSKKVRSAVKFAKSDRNPNNKKK